MRITKQRHTRLYSAIAVAGSLLASDVALAQLEEVVVTARKRTESMQDVPMAISAFGQQQLKDNQISDITDLQKMTPNITVNETSGLVAGAVQVYVRGIGNDPGFDQGVGIYVDDVYLNRTTGALLEVYDIQRIEVLKGPQGNLYGRNTIGGAIKYVSREPGDELEMTATLQTGNDDLLKAKGSVSGPLLPGSLYAGLGFSIVDQDGYQKNLFDGSDWAGREAHALRGTLLWEASESLSLKLVADYNKDESNFSIPNRVAIREPNLLGISDRLTGANEFFGAGTAVLDEPTDITLPSDVDHVNTAFLSPGYADMDIETRSLAATITWEINDAWTLKSISAIRELDNTRAFDYDGSDQVNIDTFNGLIASEDISQELQLNFSSENLEAVVGLYYLDGIQSADKPKFTRQTTRLRFFSDHNKTTYLDDREIDSISLYANVDWDFAEDWQLSIGGRYTEDEKSLKQVATVEETFYAGALATSPLSLLMIAPGQEAFVENQPGFLFWFPNTLAQSLIDRGIPSDPPLDSAIITRATTVTYNENTQGDETWSEFSPSLRLSHFLGEDTLVYAGFSSGFKSGGIATPGAIATPYDPETVDSYTLGLKTTLLDGSLRLNGEIFFNDYTDKQLATIVIDSSGGLQQITDNVGEVETSGFDFELMWLPPIDGMTVSLNLGYLDSDVKKFPKVDDDDESPTFGETIDVADITALGHSPEWSGQARVAYDYEFSGGGNMLIAGDVAYRDEMYTDSPIDTTNDFRSQSLSDSLTTYNAIIAYTTADQHWRIALEGKNLSDERELVNTFNADPNIIIGGYTRQRSWAFSVAYTY